MPVGLTMELSHRHGPGLLFALLAAAAWLVLATRSPSLTHHFAPMVIGGSWAAVGRLGHSTDVAVAWLGGLTIAISVYLVLLGTASLQGPALFEFLPTKVELPVFAVVGATASSLWQFMKLQPDPAPNPADS